jgi:hypothetical protein
MAWGGSGLFVSNIIDALDPTQLALDLSLTTNKWALFDATLTPNYDVAAASAAYAAGVWASGEITGTGYTAGGAAVASPTFTGASGIATYDQADTQWTGSTITAARGTLNYAGALTPKAGICAVDFGTTYSTVNGTFLIQWNALGVWTIDLVP